MPDYDQDHDQLFCIQDWVQEREFYNTIVAKPTSRDKIAIVSWNEINKNENEIEKYNVINTDNMQFTANYIGIKKTWSPKESKTYSLSYIQFSLTCTLMGIRRVFTSTCMSSDAF